MRALVTGISGFVGSHLTQALLAVGAEVHGYSQKPFLQTGVTTTAGDIRDRRAVTQLVAECRPTHVFHLAGSLAGDPATLFEINVAGTAILLEATRGAGVDRILVASSSAVYGASKQLPISEDQPFMPTTPYGASKAAQEMVALEFHLAGIAPTVRARMFNLVGPGLGPHLVFGRVAAQIVAAERGGDPVVRVGNLEAARDFIDVRDAAQALLALAQVGEPGAAYNVCSGKATEVRRGVEILARTAGTPVTVRVDPSLVRPNDIPEQHGSRERVTALTGWAPAITIERSLRDTLDYARGPGSGTAG